MAIPFMIALIPVAAGYMAHVVCRRDRFRNKSPGWHRALVSALITGLAIATVLTGEDLFRPSRWDTGRIPLYFGLVFGSGTGLGLVVSLIVVAHHREQFMKNGEAEKPDQPLPRPSSPVD